MEIEGYNGVRMNKEVASNPCKTKKVLAFLKRFTSTQHTWYFSRGRLGWTKTPIVRSYQVCFHIRMHRMVGLGFFAKRLT